MKAPGIVKNVIKEMQAQILLEVSVGAPSKHMMRLTWSEDQY